MTEIDEVWDDTGPTRGAGWLSFAGALLILSGGFKIWDALWAFKYDNVIAEEIQTVLFERDPVAWGWMWLVSGIVLIAAGIAVVGGARWAKWIGIAAASVAIILNYSWMFVQPVWSLFTQGVLLAVIYALLVYGGRPNNGTIQ